MPVTLIGQFVSVRFWSAPCTGPRTAIRRAKESACCIARRVLMRRESLASRKCRLQAGSDAGLPPAFVATARATSAPRGADDDAAVARPFMTRVIAWSVRSAKGAAFHLPFADHGHQFNAREKNAGAATILEAEHRPGSAINCRVV
jgi:hypothetical protein